MKKVLLSLLLFTSLLYSNETKETDNSIFQFNYDSSVINNINFEERRQTNQFVIDFFKQSEDNQEYKIVKLEIPSLFNTNISCGGITANFEDVFDIIMTQFEGIIAKLPEYVAQRMLGTPDFDSPGAMFEYAQEQSVNLYCYGEVYGIQTIQTTAETTLDYIQKLYVTAEEEDDSQEGTSLINGSGLAQHDVAEQEQERTTGYNENAQEKSEAEMEAETLKNQQEKFATCVKDRKDSLNNILNSKIQKFTPLINSKKKMFKSACEIIKEKGKRNNLNDKLPNGGVFHSPIYYGTENKPQKLKIDNEVIKTEISLSEDDKVLTNAYLDVEKINKIFEDENKLYLYKKENLDNSDNRLFDKTITILNQFSECLNDSYKPMCIQLSNDDKFLFNFNDSSDYVEGFSNILIKKKKICSYITSSKDMYLLNLSFNEILKVNGYSSLNITDTKNIVKGFIENEYCGSDFDDEIDRLKKILNTNVDKIQQDIINSYIIISNNLQTLKKNEVAFDTIDKTKETKIKRICAYNSPKKGETVKVYFQTENGMENKEFSNNEEVKMFFEQTYNIDIFNYYSKFPIIATETSSCDVDKNSKLFKDAYNKILEEKKQNKLAYKSISSITDYLNKIKEDRTKSLLKAVRMNEFYSELGNSVITKILNTKVKKILFLLKN